MPSLIRPRLPVPGSPIKKQRVSSDDDTLFPYPTLPDDCVNKDDATDFIEWGNNKVAENRSLIEPKVTESNLRLFRTYHPSLGQFGTVLLVEEFEQTWIWVASPGLSTTRSISTHAGGLEIHPKPAGFIERTTTMWPKYRPDPISILTPRRFLSRKQLHRLREMFPTSLGARVLISGFIVILFKSRANIENFWQHDGLAGTFGALRITYELLEDMPTQKIVSKGAAITATPDCFDGYAALGLKIHFPGGQEAITAPTHAFAALRGIRSASFLRIADCYMNR
ncbi:uncharacterized protein N7484_001621 [Penicillium longicatenatum]|uniref:uncharacterized protein n=1 Tax=Penicillium longicatenatum TaxID=1561947 RepID=UPI0025483FEB|nr:uncharacterized protein N7484_001621 [Penicillium longicatenatum]KAJ5657972.1 hypothetical protein N7484_001621 [Penicillium longicatenatum]